MPYKETKEGQTYSYPQTIGKIMEEFWEFKIYDNTGQIDSIKKDEIKDFIIHALRAYEEAIMIENPLSFKYRVGIDWALNELNNKRKEFWGE